MQNAGRDAYRAPAAGRKLDLTRRPGLFIFGVVLLACLLINSGSFSSSDTLRRSQVTHWLWLNAPQVVPPWHGIIGRGGRLYAQWGIGQSLLMLPADIISHPVIAHLHSAGLRAQASSGMISYLTFPLLNALAALLAYHLLLELAFSPAESALGALALAFATSFLPYAEFQQENSLIFFALIGGFLGNIRWLRTQRFRDLCFGVFCLGWSFLVKLPCLLDAAMVWIFVALAILSDPALPGRRLARLARYCAGFAVLYAPFILVDRFYQWRRFGSFTNTYFSIQQAQMRITDPNLPFYGPFFKGFDGLLFSPGKSIFLFNPLIVLAAILVAKYHRLLDRKAIVFFGLALLLLLADTCFYARLAFWTGDGAWGPRYVVTPSQLVALLAVPVLVRAYPLLRSGLERLLYQALLAFACFVQILSVLFDYNLELFQEDAFHVKYLIIWQRLVNTVALATGSFRHWGLDPGFASTGNARLITLAFMPWRNAALFHGRVALLLQAAWLSGFAVLFALLMLYVLQLRARTARAPEPGPAHGYFGTWTGAVESAGTGRSADEH